MSRAVSVEQVEQLAAQLPLSDQLRLVARICEQVSTTMPSELTIQAAPPAHIDDVESWLQACDEIADSIEGEFDAVEDLHELRQERPDRE